MNSSMYKYIERDKEMLRRKKDIEEHVSLQGKKGVTSKQTKKKLKLFFWKAMR